MKKNKKTTGIQIRNGSDIKIIKSKFEGLDVAIDADNITNLKLEDNLIEGRLISSNEWYKDRIFLLGILTFIVDGIPAWSAIRSFIG